MVTTLPGDLAVLLVSVTARQAGSPTATGHARLVRDPGESTLLGPLHGAFNSPVATLLVHWRER